ncbi:MAG: oligosaccharide flippase family protein [Pirellulales bacterium]
MNDKEHAVRQVRGSSVLLFGRVISLSVNLLLQLLLVRYLTKDAFGSFAFAWASVEFWVFVATLGLNKALSRYVPMYQEVGDWERLRRAVLRTLNTVLVAGLLIIGGVLASESWLETSGWVDPLSLRLLRILIFLAPLDALGYVFQDLFVAFEDITAVFVRRYVLAPGLRLAAVVGVMLAGGDAEWMAAGYVGGGVIGLVMYLWLFRRLWNEKMSPAAATARLAARGAELAATEAEAATAAGAEQEQVVPRMRELFRFGMAVLTSQLGGMFRMTAVIYLLQILRSNEEVGDYRAVLPFARLNLMVLDNFTVAFVPAVSRLLVRREDSMIGRLVDTSAAWVTALTFPVFLASCVFSPALTRYLLGANYADAWPVMSVLALGCLIESLLGFAPQVLRAYAKLRPVLFADVAALVINMVLIFLLAPKFGATGAAISVSVSSVIAAVTTMIAARRENREACRWRTVATMLAYIAGAALPTAAVLVFFEPPLVVQMGLAASAGLAFLALIRRRLTVDDVFPELRKIPFVNWLVPRPATPAAAASGDSPS